MTINKNTTHKYKLLFDLEMTVGEFSISEVLGKSKNATDALLVGSLIDQYEGKPNIDFSSFDGRSDGEPVSGDDLYEFLIRLAEK